MRLAFTVGEKVVYPNQGIGVVESIKPRGTPDGQLDGYELRMQANESKVWIPLNAAAEIGVRPVIGPGDADKVIETLADSNVEVQNNWKGRFQENSDRMRTGSVFAVAEVLKGLNSLSQRKALSFREKRMLERARFLIVSEVAEACGQSEASVEERVDSALKRSEEAEAP